MKRLVAVSAALLAVLAGAGGTQSKKVSIVDEEILVKLSPVPERPREISNWHEAYLSDHKLMGSMVLKGTDREAMLDLAAKRGARLVFVVYGNLPIGKKKRLLTGYYPWDKWKAMDVTYVERRVPGFYVEMYAPGRNYEEGMKRFCDVELPPSLEKGWYRCGTMEDMKRYLDLGADPTRFLYLLVRHAYEIAGNADMRRVSDVLPEMRKNLEMIVLTLDRGADALTVSGDTAYMLKLLAAKLRTDAPQAENASRWPPHVADPGQRAGADFALAFFVEVQRIVDEWAKR